MDNPYLIREHLISKELQNRFRKELELPEPERNEERIYSEAVKEIDTKHIYLKDKH